MQSVNIDATEHIIDVQKICADIRLATADNIVTFFSPLFEKAPKGYHSESTKDNINRSLSWDLSGLAYL